MKEEALDPLPVAIVGAGIAGLTCAGRLGDRGIRTVLFDKGRRPGGRLATHEKGVGTYDHGAPYFTVRDPKFETQVRSWIEAGVVAPWKASFVAVEGDDRRPIVGAPTHYVGVPQMNTIAARMARSLDVRSSVRIERVERRGAGWFLGHEAGEEGPFGAVVVAVPAPQAGPLLVASPELQGRAAEVRMTVCSALMVGFERPLEVDFDGAFVYRSPLRWVGRNGCKPGRAGETWVLHASSAWSEAHLDSDPDDIAAGLLEAFASVARIELPVPLETRLHRWRYALPAQTLPDSDLFDAGQGLGVCGDACGRSGVEGAWLSGEAAADRLASWIEDGQSGRSMS